MPGLRALVVLVLAFSTVDLSSAARAGNGVEAAPVPPEMRTSFFAVTVNRQRVDVAHAASNYEFVNFDMTGPVEISITAADPHFWDRGVDIEPWRLGLRAVRTGPTIHIHLEKPAKLSISRPGDFLNEARMLFVFAGMPPAPAADGSERHHCSRRRASRKPQSQKRRHHLSRAGRVCLRQPEPVAGRKCEGAGPRNDRLRRPAGSERRRRLDAEARLALHRRATRRTTSRSTGSPASFARAPGRSR